MSQYLRLHVGDIVFAVHYTEVLEVGQWQHKKRQEKIIWREQTVPLVMLSELLSLPASRCDSFVVMGENSENKNETVMVIVDRIEPLVTIPENEFTPVLAEDASVVRLANEAWYNGDDDLVLLKLDVHRLIASLASCV